MIRPWRIALIAGDGIGHEVVPAAGEVLATCGVSVELRELVAGWACFQETGTSLPEATLQGLQQVDGALFGAVGSPSHPVPGYRSPIVELRRWLDLYANLRPCRSAPLAGSREGIDLLIVRENTEGLYAGRERRDGDMAIAERLVTRSASARIARVACEQARRRRQQLTVVHKANVLRITDGFFREVVLEVTAGYPDLRVDEGLVDSTAYHLVRDARRFDVILTTNLFGDILSDLAAGLTGGLGLAASANLGDSFVLAEPVHGSAPDIAGQGIANPLAAIRAAALLLHGLGEVTAGQRIEQAVDQVLTAGPHTPDLGGHATTREVTQAVIANLVQFVVRTSVR
jgi:homoisocitrate dehydrogenase